MSENGGKYKNGEKWDIMEIERMGKEEEEWRIL